MAANSSLGLAASLFGLSLLYALFGHGGYATHSIFDRTSFDDTPPSLPLKS